MNRSLQKAIRLVGTQAELARRIAAFTKNNKVKPQHVWNWLNRDKCVPDWSVLAIEAATNDEKTGRPRVLRNDLRPDLYPEERVA